ncbi:MAG: aldehyde dehydrogenase family protein [bacterium]
MKKQVLYIDGRWEEGKAGRSFPAVNPATEETLAEVAVAAEEDVDAAVRAARRAFDQGAWPRMDPRERAAFFFELEKRIAEHSSDLSEIETRDAGMVIRVSSGMVLPLVGLFCQRYAEMAQHLVEPESKAQSTFPALSWDYTVREPIGVVACIVPWNFPLFLATWKIIPALIAGNTVVLKPSSAAPLSLLELTRLIDSLGLPKGVFNLITGPGAQTGNLLSEHPMVDKISMTGSTEVGREIMSKAARDLKRVTLELGGKNPAIVLEDANLEMAADGVLYGGLMHQGQVCMSGSRVYVPRSLYADFAGLLVERARTLVLGDPMDGDTDIGPVISSQQRERVLRYIQQGRKEGARLLLGGGPPEGDAFARGFWVEPTLFGDASQDMVISREEIFGPVLCLIPYEEEEEAVNMANDTRYGLTAGIWSADLDRANRIARRLRAGTVFVNDWHTLSPNFPFGGYKQSGIGRESGLEGLYEFTELKTVHINIKTKREESFWFQLLLGNAGD